VNVTMYQQMVQTLGCWLVVSGSLLPVAVCVRQVSFRWLVVSGSLLPVGGCVRQFSSQRLVVSGSVLAVEGFVREGPGKYSGTVEGHLSRPGQDTMRQVYSSAQNVE